jgi:O-acetyl-ADP-ribose deacetylase (regulator of RNase III)
MIKLINGNIFTSDCQVIVNTVNCVGVMGAGIALECRFRYPEMYSRYLDLCKENKIQIGQLWLYKSNNRWILNFPTKKDWKRPSSVSYLRAGLEKFCETYQERGINSIAFPLLGADKGKLDPNLSVAIMKEYLEKLDLKVEIYKYDPRASDDLYDRMKARLVSKDIRHIASETGVKPNYIKLVIEALNREDVCQISQIAKTKGVGIKTMEKLFRFATKESIEGENLSLFS